jgi:hypothetical protein
MKRWWYHEGVQVISHAYEINLESRTIDKPEARWRVRSSELAETAYGLFLLVYGQSLNVEKCRPDLDDPGTLGFLEAAVRAAYKGLVVTTQGNEWWSVETDSCRWDHDNTESFGEALIKALEAAE